MGLHLKDIGVLTIFAVGMLVALLGNLTAFVLAVILILLLLLTSNQLRLKLSSMRDRYYLIGPTFFYTFGLLAIAGLRHTPLAILLFFAFILLAYGLLSSLFVRHEEPLNQQTLYQNIFLSTIWISLFLAILTLYNLLSQTVVSLIAFIFLSVIVVFLITQSLFHYVRIAPWMARRESGLAAWGIGQPLLILALWTVNPLMVAGSAFLLLYLFWGLVYHSYTKQLTRKILYEYLLMSVIGLTFLLAVTKFSPSL